MSADWKLQQAVFALRSGAQSVLADDPDADLSEMPELAEDAAAVETAMRQLVRQIQDAQDIATVARQRAAEASDRARRFDARAARYKGLILAAMDAMGWRKREFAEGTVSIRRGVQGVLILKEDDIPAEYFVQHRTVDKPKIKADINANKIIPGAALANGMPSIVIKGN